MVNVSGSVRVDLLGGTIDLNPINLILPHAFTLNLATSLKAKADIEKINDKKVIIESLDYGNSFSYAFSDFTEENFRSEFFGPMNFVCQIINHFKLTEGIRLRLESGSPAGAGLGGSSSMGVTLYKALCQLTNKKLDKLQAIQTVQSIEARILNSGPAGYQDYYPALHGGVLALKPAPGEVVIEQLYCNELKDFLEKHITLVYSGQTRLSGINNWEVYKAFFDKNEAVRKGLEEIAVLSYKAYCAIKAKDFDKLPELIGNEGKVREKLFSGIVSPKMREVFDILIKDVPELGMKVCGAGGGGCFLLIHNSSHKEVVAKAVQECGMTILEFNIDRPLED